MTTPQERAIAESAEDTDAMTPKQRYEARKADRRRRREARETLGSDQKDIIFEDMIDRFVTAVERIADALEAR